MDKSSDATGDSDAKRQFTLSEAERWIWRCAAKESEAITTADRDYWHGMRVTTEMVHGITFEQIKAKRQTKRCPNCGGSGITYEGTSDDFYSGECWMCSGIGKLNLSPDVTAPSDISVSNEKK